MDRQWRSGAYLVSLWLALRLCVVLVTNGILISHFVEVSLTNLFVKVSLVNPINLFAKVSRALNVLVHQNKINAVRVTPDHSKRISCS